MVSNTEATGGVRHDPGVGGLPRRHHRTAARPVREPIGRTALRCLARRGGVKRIGGQVYDAMRLVLRQFVRDVVGDAAVIAEYSKRRTVTAMDVVYALKRLGRTTLYGYDSMERPVSSGRRTAAAPRPSVAAQPAAPPPPGGVDVPALRAAWIQARDRGDQTELVVRETGTGAELGRCALALLRDAHAEVLVRFVVNGGGAPPPQPTAWPPVPDVAGGRVVLVGPVVPVASPLASGNLLAAVAVVSDAAALVRAMQCLWDNDARAVVVGLRDVPPAVVREALATLPPPAPSATQPPRRRVVLCQAPPPAIASSAGDVVDVDCWGDAAADPLAAAVALAVGGSARVALVVPVRRRALAAPGVPDLLRGSPAADWASRTSVALWTGDGHPALFSDAAYRVEDA